MVVTEDLTVFEEMASWDDFYPAASIQPANLDHPITQM